MKKKVAFVIGSGIAGVSLAEILSRNDYKVVLLESKEKIGGEASLATQKWFHTGWLYAGLVDRAASLGCYKALNLYRKVYGETFGEERININVTSAGVEYPDSPNGWFKNDRINYVVAMSSYEMDMPSRVYWPVYFRTVYMRRMKRFHYDFQTVEPSSAMKELMNRWEDSPRGFRNYRIIRSTDAKIETEQVIRDLVCSLDEQTEIVTGAEYHLISSDSSTKLKIGGLIHSPDLVVIASGKSIPSHLVQIGANRYVSQIKSIKSPIWVLGEKVELPDFIRYTPIVPYTVNHIKFNVNGFRVSTAGSYYSFPVDKTVDIDRYKEIVLERLGLSNDVVLGSYFGIKTEYTGDKDRRYNHAVMKVNNNTYFALAGKFSQFPLLVYDFASQLGLSISRRPNDSFISVEPNIFAASLPGTIMNPQAELVK